MTSRRAPSQRDPEFVAARLARALQSMSPGTMGGRAANASPVSVMADPTGLVLVDSGGGGVGGQIRNVGTYTTAALSVGAIETGTISLSSDYRILYIATDVPARVRLYTTTAAQTADLGRSTTTAPAPGLGIVMDYLTALALLEAPLSPVAEGATFSDPLSSDIPISVTSVNGGVVTVTLTWVTFE